MLKEHYKVVTGFRRMLDIVLGYGAYFLTLMFCSLFSFVTLDSYSNDAKMVLAIGVGIIWWVVLDRFGLYRSHRFEPFYKQVLRIIKAHSVSGIIALAFVTFCKFPPLPRKFLFIFLLTNFVLIMLESLLIRHTAAYFRALNLNIRNVLIVGNGIEAEEMLERIHAHPGWGIRLIGIIAPGTGQHLTRKSASLIAKFPNINFFGNLNDFQKITRENVIDMVFFAVSPWDLSAVQAQIQYCILRGIDIELNATFFDKLDFVKIFLDEIDTKALISFETTNNSPYLLLLKEMIDRSLAFIGITLISPLLCLIAIAIRLESRGPVLFKQKRVGRHGRVFEIFKFRSMVIDAESKRAELSSLNEMSGPVFKITNDPRITRVGKLLRKTSLDELPQLLNVLIGDMSLVGPRPPLPTEVDQYDDWQLRRLSVKPGITCTWQVSGRNKIDFDTWMKMDLDYIDKWSLLNDAKLLLKTMPAVLFQYGAK